MVCLRGWRVKWLCSCWQSWNLYIREFRMLSLENFSCNRPILLQKVRTCNTKLSQIKKRIPECKRPQAVFGIIINMNDYKKRNYSGRRMLWQVNFLQKSFKLSFFEALKLIFLSKIRLPWIYQWHLLLRVVSKYIDWPFVVIFWISVFSIAPRTDTMAQLRKTLTEWNEVSRCGWRMYHSGSSSNGWLPRSSVTSPKKSFAP